MKKDPYQDELKAIKHLQARSEAIQESHGDIAKSLDELKSKLDMALQGADTDGAEFQRLKAEHMKSMTQDGTLQQHELSAIYQEAKELYPGAIELHEILVKEDVLVISERIGAQVEAFNARYSLDAWDYVIATNCGLLAAMLDMFFVHPPVRSTKLKFDQPLDGFFNRTVQDAFNKLIPPELSEILSKSNKIYGPDASVWNDLIDAPNKVLNPVNHRLVSLSHDPILGFIVGVLDMMNNTCTVVDEGVIKVFNTTKPQVEGSVFELLGRMLGHLLSDVNAPSGSGNRGMGLPAPFMGLLRLFDGVKIGGSDFATQVEWLYINGYDFRHFVVTSVPMAIMEVVMRACYVAKQVKLHDAGFGESLLDTMPMNLNPRFRIMLAIAYGTSSAVNAGKIYITHNILNLNYASWMGFAWNGAHALKWALMDRSLALWSGIEESAIQDIETIVMDLEGMADRAAKLPT